MTSLPSNLLGAAEANPSLLTDALPTVGGSAAALLYIDQILASLAIVSALVAGGVWLGRGRRDPLVAAPARQNSMREEVIFLAMLAYMIAYLGFSLLLGIEAEGDSSSSAAWLAGSAAQILGIVACVVLATSRFERGAAGFLLGSPRPSPLTSLGLVLAMIVLALGLCPLVLEATVTTIRWFDPGVSFPLHSTLESLRDGSQSDWMRVGLWVGAAVLAPVAEELFFRGIVQTVILNVTRKRWLAIGVSSAVFALVHLSQPHVVPALFLFGFLLGFCYERRGSLLLPIVIHSLFNLKTLIWEWVQRTAA